MLFKNVIASALLIAGGLAAPLQAAAVEDNNHTKMSPREYWAFAIKLRENEMHAAKRNDHPNLVAREYWAFAIKLRSGVSAKRSILDSQCEIADEGIYCNYSSADIEAYGSTGHLQEGCITVETGVACFYPGSFTPNDQ